jgi:transcriptional regulator with XRE-family HTH domain
MLYNTISKELLPMLKNSIKKLRAKIGLTQEQLGEKLGFDHAAISQWETGKREPDYSTLKKLAEFFGVSTDFLLYGAEPDKTILPDHEVLILADDNAGGHKLVDISTLPENEQKMILDIINTYKQKHQK